MEGVEGVVEAAAVACPAPGGGPEQLHLFLVVHPDAAQLGAGELQRRCQAAISSKLNPLFKVGWEGAAAGRPGRGIKGAALASPVVQPWITRCIAGLYRTGKGRQAQS